MRTGELTESVRKRAVLRQLHLENACGYGDGDLCGLIFASSGPLPGYTRMPWRQVTAAANSLAADGAVPLGLCLQGILPEDYEEPALRDDMRRFAAEAEANGMQFYDASVQVSSAAALPRYFITAVGRPYRDESPEQASSELCPEQERTSPVLCPGQERTYPVLRPGQALVVTRAVALAGTAALATVCERELSGRFSFRLIDQAKGFGRWMSVTETARAVNHFGAYPMRCIAQGGIFNALWEMAERAGVGLEVDLKRIPVKQETIEICEYFDMNPYYLYSAGALLIGTEQPEALIALLRERDVPACVIGRVTDGKARVIRNGETIRYLDRPGPDELWKLGENSL